MNVRIPCSDELAGDAAGSFHIAQILCHEFCLLNDLTEKASQEVVLAYGIESVKGRVLAELARTLLPRAIRFARGSRFRREGRAPYLHLLRWLSEADDGTVSIDDALALHPNNRGSVGQVVQKGYLALLLEDDADLQETFHYDPFTRVLGVEDPKLVYFLRNLLWSKFVKQVGYISVEFRSRWDFALSFAGEDRAIVERLKATLQEHEIEVFYDKDEQYRILAEDVEQYLAPIYRSQARFVIPFISPSYPKKVWTKFEVTTVQR